MNTSLCARYARYSSRGGCGRAPSSNSTGVSRSAEMARATARRSSASSPRRGGDGVRQPRPSLRRVAGLCVHGHVGWNWSGGEHAMAGTRGAQIIAELAAHDGEFVLPKRFYSSFHETGLDPLLRQFAVDTLVLAGQHTNLCVRHTTADAFFRGYQVIVPPDAVESLSEEDHQSGLRYLDAMYKVDLPDTKQLLQL